MDKVIVYTSSNGKKSAYRVPVDFSERPTKKNLEAAGKNVSIDVAASLDWDQLQKDISNALVEHGYYADETQNKPENQRDYPLIRAVAERAIIGLLNNRVGVS